MRFSVIITTYNQPRYLELVLYGYSVQTRRDFEIIIADDGSGPETAEVIERARRELGLDIRHVWHEDRGFRKCEILNRAILAASGDYLLFTDGDCVPRKDLVETHMRLAAPGRFIAGGYLKLPPEVSRAVDEEAIRTGAVTDLRWLRARGWRPGRRALRLVRSHRLGALFDLLTPTRAVFQGNNASTWRAAIEAVNGFEQEMGYGGLDRGIGYRLENYGIKGVQARHRAVCMHLHHERPYRDEAVIRRNREILARIRRTGETRARRGLDELRASIAER